MSTPIDLERARELLRAEALRFLGHRDDDVRDVRAHLRAGVRDIDAVRAILPRGGEAALFAAIALASVDDATGLAVLRDPHAYFCTNSCVEVGLALCARLVLGDVEPPLRFINASLLGELAVLVGAVPTR